MRLTVPSTTSEITTRINRIENTLLLEARAPGETAKTAALAERMDHHKTPGVSIAAIHGGQVEWGPRLRR